MEQGAMLPPAAEDGGSPKHPGCPAGRQLLPDPLAGSRRAVGCCWETPGVLPPQLILARFLLIMEREGIAASQQAQPLPVPLPAPLPAPCLLLGGLGGAGAGAYPPPSDFGLRN